MTFPQLLRLAGVLALAGAGCSTSSSSSAVHDAGKAATDSGDDASTDAPAFDSSEPVDGTVDAESEPDTSTGPPVDAAPVDAAFLERQRLLVLQDPRRVRDLRHGGGGPGSRGARV